ncbi:unnamed protein product [Mycena citricolor]|uniref:type I protein arginine methyltransferase n=1 Tax=Mycena citricolor TaxID=2018698 RepID=A0AAD2HGV6_9AGAR|nr:unnamed protein product [Mycena citricolor]CAK5274550.1 unnamed protein product [Mycena citricolor]CAK5276672.1 unnamed protein product [Mycena citricolor]
MSVRLPPIPSGNHSDSGSCSSSSSSDGEEETWDDWVSESGAGPCKSLFDETVLESAKSAGEHDKVTHGVDLDALCARFKLDTYQRIRFINYMRKTKPSPADVLALTGSEALFTSDEYLQPVIEDDPLLQIEPEDWSDSDAESSTDPVKRIRALERKLAAAQQDLIDYRQLVSKQLDVPALIAAVNEPTAAGKAPTRDDDSHYFQSYAENDIHLTMLTDHIRTSSYAAFILTNPQLFHNATVLDVGCGTGILSLFAARAGAKRVFAVDASDVAEKADRIVHENGMEHIIKVVRGKIEDVVLPFDDGEEQKVDIIVSEWMGYALLYESMLDSVLVARDRFLKPGGVLAPSQMRMMFALCDGSDIVKERIKYWDDVYGFDLSPMAEHVADEAIVDVVGPETTLSVPYCDLYLQNITPRNLSFVSPFTLTCTSIRRTKITSFILYFDTFFAPDGQPISENEEVRVVKTGEAMVTDVWPVGGRPAPMRRASSQFSPDGEPKPLKITSFSTGPQSVPTHWKQTLFLLRDPIVAEEGSVVTGHFHCKKSDANSRELDVEIHYAVRSPDAEQPGDTVVQMYKVR